MENKPRIHFAVTNDLVHDRRMMRIGETLAKAGYEITLVGRSWPGKEPFAHPQIRGVRLPCRFRKGPLFYAEYNIRLLAWLIRHPAEIRCACDLDTMPAIRVAQWFRRSRTVYDAHEYFTGVPELTGRPFVRAVWQAIARWGIPKFDLRYTVGEELAKRMSKEYGSPFHVIRNIAPPPAEDVGPPSFGDRQKRILYQGAINVGRGLETAIDAMQALPDWSLWLAGEGDIDDALKARVDSLGLSGRVRFLGWVAPDRLPALLRESLISINLREAGSVNDFYSLPNKCFDAMHAGTPSIHMDYPEYRAIVSRFRIGVLLDTVDAASVVRAVHAIGNDPAAWAYYSEECRRAAGHYTWASEAKTLVSLYAKL